jgi:hypothetical protein
MVLGKRTTPDKQQLYEGGFSNHMFEGYGKLTVKGHFHYEGFFRNNLMEGQGWISYEDGSRYEGMFREGKKHGSGVWRRGEERF